MDAALTFIDQPIGWGFALALGFFLVMWGADVFVDNAASLATRLRVPSVAVGLLVVGFGTSAPEAVVSATASLEGSPGMAVGNAIGSNITNLALILGLVVFLRPTVVNAALNRFELPLLVGSALLVMLLLFDHALARVDAALLTLGLLAFLWRMRSSFKKNDDDTLAPSPEHEPLQEETASSSGVTPGMIRVLLLLCLGLVVLLFSAEVLVWGAKNIALSLGVEPVIVGLTVVAFGTSLPELAASLAALRRKEDDLAVGNVVGSNLFNTLLVLALPGWIHPHDLPASVFWRDALLCVILSAALWLHGRLRPALSRPFGAVLLTTFVGYVSLLIWQAASPSSFFF